MVTLRGDLSGRCYGISNGIDEDAEVTAQEVQLAMESGNTMRIYYDKGLTRADIRQRLWTQPQ